MPDTQEINAARKAFVEREPRNLFYKVATELVNLALQGGAPVSLGEALAVLLQTWNRAFYQYHKFTQDHFSAIELLLNNHLDIVRQFRIRTMSSLIVTDKNSIEELFKKFEGVLGPVGAAKSLHLLAPEFFPLWDRAIAKAYQLPPRPRGTNAASYYNFMLIVQRQCANLQGKTNFEANLLKALDEYNYCKFTKKWI